MELALKLTSKKTPYIDFPNLGHISFVSWSKSDKGYTHLHFSFKDSLNLSFLTDMSFKPYNIAKSKVFSKREIKDTVKLLEPIFSELTTNGLFPHNNINSLSQKVCFVSYDFEKKQKNMDKFKVTGKIKRKVRRKK